MSTTTTPAATTAPGTATAARTPTVTAVAPRLSFAGILRGEWIKLLSLRSTWWMLAITVAVMALVALAVAAGTEVSPDFAPHGAELITAGYQIGMLTVAVLGALVMTGEYTTGMVRSTFAAVPARTPVLAAKAVALAVVTVLATAASIVVGYVVSRPFLSELGLVPALDDPATWQTFAGMAFFFVAVALFSLGLGTVLRHTSGTIATTIAVLLLLPAVLQFVNVTWIQEALAYLPLPAAMPFLLTTDAFGSSDALTAWQGVAVVGGYAAAALIAGAVSLRRRDV